MKLPCDKNLKRCHKVRIYANKNLARISTIYSQSVGVIDDKFRSRSNKYKSVCDLEENYFLSQNVFFINFT